MTLELLAHLLNNGTLVWFVPAAHAALQATGRTQRDGLHALENAWRLRAGDEPGTWWATGPDITWFPFRVQVALRGTGEGLIILGLDAADL